MSFLKRLFRPQVELSPELLAQVQAWRGLAAVGDRMRIEGADFVMVDVETSGLDPRRDRLMSIGAVTLSGLRLDIGNSFEVIVQQPETSARDNILIHGIGPARQASGVEPELALLAFLEFSGKAPLIAFHAPFDQSVIDRALRQTLGVRLLNPWIDLAQLAPALYPEARLARAALDDWLAFFHLRAFSRHRAVDDATATGELFLILLKRAQAQGLNTIGSLQVTADAHQRKLQGSSFGGV